MSRVYESLKKGMHDTLQRGKVTPINTPRLIETHSSLASAVEAVENLREGFRNYVCLGAFQLDQGNEQSCPLDQSANL